MALQFLFSFLTYFAILLTIGIIAHRKHTTEADFIIGGRSLNFWVTAISAHASDMSSWLFMSFPMAVFVGGLSQCWIAVGLLSGMFLSWHFVAPKLRVTTEKLNAYTLSSFFEKRFNDTSGALRFLSALMTLLFTVHYLSAGLTAMGFIFESIFHFDYYYGITIATVVIAIYTFYGGFVTVAWTDLFQGIFLLFIVILVPLVAIGHVEGGFATISTLAAQKEISLSFFPEPTLMKWLGIFFLVFGWGLGYFGQPHIITKFMGIRDPAELYKSKYLGISWQFLALTAATFIGIVGIGYFPSGLHNPELVFVEMVRSLFVPFFAGLILCGMLAATISTMDSQIIVSASVMTEDLYKLLINKNASSERMLLMSRLAVLVVAAAAYIIALDKSKTVMDTVTYSWSGLGCSFGPLVLMSLYYPKANRYGAFAGILSGGLIAGTWDNTLNPMITDMEIPAMIPGFTLGLVLIYLVSYLTRNRDGREVASSK